MINSWKASHATACVAITVALYAWVPVCAHAQDPAETKRTFQRGVAALQDGRFAEAQQAFSRITALGREEKLYTAALYLQARSDFHSNNSSAAAEGLRALLEANPKSRYADQAHYLLGIIAFNDGNYAEAASEFVWVVDRGQTPALKNASLTYAQTLFEEYLQPADMRRRLRRDYLGPEGLALVALKLARAELVQGRRAEGQKLIDEFLRLYPNTMQRKQLEQWYVLPEGPDARTVRIGVILPLSGVDSEGGRALYRGIRYAQISAKNEDPVVAESGRGSPNVNSMPVCEFVVRDSESSIVGSLKAAQLLLADPTIVALIGEIDGPASAAIAALAQEKGKPILIPVATHDGLTALGENVFQMNPSREVKSRALAEYAFRYLNCRTFITLAPQDGYGHEMTDGFSAAVDSLGGEILAQKWYYGQPTDLSRMFKALREATLRRGLEDSLRASGVTVDASNRNSLWRDYNYRVASSNKDHEDAVASLSNPVTNVSAVFLPLYVEDIRLIVYQLNSFNIRGLRLGGEHWQGLDADARRELHRLLDGTVFASDYFVDWEGERGRQFRTSYRKAMGATPDRYDVYGYDAASLMLGCVRKGARQPYQIRQALRELSGYPGLKGQIDFNNPERVNSSVNILQYSGNTLRKLR
jgi:ABC-type branched-subunit amino acid transport system substrate-binding protein